MTEQAGPLEVHKAIVAVAAELCSQGIGKDSRNKEQQFNFRGIDDVLNALSPLLVKHSLHVVPRILSHKATTNVNAKGTLWTTSVVEMEYTIFCAKDGSKVSGGAVGEGRDAADKSTAKAASIAYKYWAIQAFSIPTVGVLIDGDAEHPEINGSGDSGAGRRQKPDVITLDDVRAAIADGDLSTRAMADRLSLCSQADNDTLLSGLTDSENDIISAAWPQ